MHVTLAKNRGHEWTVTHDVSFKGYFFDEAGAFFQGKDACLHFSRLGGIDELISALKVINGFFALIIQKPEINLVAADRLRSIPLFYEKNSVNLRVSDDPREILSNQAVSPEVSSRAVSEFILSGFTVGSATLIDDICQVRPGEVIVEEDGLTSIKYYNHIAPIKPILSESQEFERLEQISARFGERLTSSLGNRQLVIPLSGGYDSRYIAALVKNAKYANVIAYTYGIKESPEVSRSKLVAERLGIKWYFVEYTSEKYRNFLNSEEHEKYIAYSHLLCSTPHYQEFLALKELISIGAIDENAIVAPGFCGDFLGGSYVPFEVKVGRSDLFSGKNLERYIAETQLYLRRPFWDAIPDEVVGSIADELKDCGFALSSGTSVQEAIQYNDAFFAQHKIAKYVVNSLRVYEYFGLEWRMPLWDNELAEYWYSVPYEFKCKYPLYNKFLEQRIFSPLGINFSRPGSGRAVRGLELIYKLRLPEKYIRLIAAAARTVLKLLPRRDPTAFDIPTEHYLNELRTGEQRLPGGKNFVVAFTRWIVFRWYGKELSCARTRRKSSMKLSTV